MRYFLDTEFNGFGGALLSFALVPEDGGEDYYCILPSDEKPHPWVARHVLPYVRTVPAPLLLELDRTAAAHDVARYLAADTEPEIVADWPEDIALFCRLLLIRETELAGVSDLRFRFLRLPGFSTARNSAVPHNALHDARALREHVLALE